LDLEEVWRIREVEIYPKLFGVIGNARIMPSGWLPRDEWVVGGSDCSASGQTWRW
jgi:hypothetical protein